MSEHVSHVTLCLTSNLVAQIRERRAGRRHKVHHNGTLCSRCLARAPASERDRYCKECRAADRRERRRIAAEEFKRLKALEEQQKLSKGTENGHDEGQGRGGAAG